MFLQVSSSFHPDPQTRYVTSAEHDLAFSRFANKRRIPVVFRDPRDKTSCSQSIFFLKRISVCQFWAIFSCSLILWVSLFDTIFPNESKLTSRQKLQGPNCLHHEWPCTYFFPVCRHYNNDSSYLRARIH